MAQSSTSTDNGSVKAYQNVFKRPAYVFPDPRLIPLATYLEHIILSLSEASNSHDTDFFSEVINRYFAPCLKVSVGEPYAHILHSTTREAYIPRMMAYLNATPNFRVDTYNITAMIEEHKGVAKVFSMNRLTGSDNENPTLTRESVLLHYFERAATGEWMCVRFDIIRGPGHLLFP